MDGMDHVNRVVRKWYGSCYQLSMKMPTQSPDIHVLDVTPQESLEVNDEDDMAPVNGVVHEDDDPIT